MSILIDGKTRVLVQGITGQEGSFQTEICIAYGTNVVAGVTPGRGGQTQGGVPVFDTVREAVDATAANCSLLFVPAPFAADAILEAAGAALPLIVCIAEGMPTLDMVRVKAHIEGSGSRLIGPNCPGLITPGQSRVGVMPPDVFSPGRVGVISRSGTLVYESVAQLSSRGIGQSSCVGVGGDPVIGTAPVEVLRLFDEDAETDAVLYIGEIGGVAEQEAAEYVRGMSKPVISFVAGATAPPGRRMGHAGAIIVGNASTAKAKKEALMDAGAVIVDSPANIGKITEEVMRGNGLI